MNPKCVEGAGDKGAGKELEVTLKYSDGASWIKEKKMLLRFHNVTSSPVEEALTSFGKFFKLYLLKMNEYLTHIHVCVCVCVCVCE
jgi:hypothetical protein